MIVTSASSASVGAVVAADRAVSGIDWCWSEGRVKLVASASSTVVVTVVDLVLDIACSRTASGSTGGSVGDASPHPD